MPESPLMGPRSESIFMTFLGFPRTLSVAKFSHTQQEIATLFSIASFDSYTYVRQRTVLLVIGFVHATKLNSHRSRATSLSFMWLNYLSEKKLSCVEE